MVISVALTCDVPTVPTVEISTTAKTPTAIPAMVSSERVLLRKMFVIAFTVIFLPPTVLAFQFDVAFLCDLFRFGKHNVPG